MPKEQKQLAAAQEQRKKIKEKYSKFVPGRISLQVLGTGAEGAPRSLYLFTDQSRYLFNCGEGTQRLAHEHKMKLAKLEHIFITHKSWKNLGGLPGTALTIQDVGVPQITLHGPKGLEDIFVATKRFVVLRDLNVEVADCNKEATFQDNVMTVTYVPIYSDNTDDLEKEGEPPNDSTSTKRQHRKRQRSCSPSTADVVYDMVEDDIDYYEHERKAPNYNFKNNRSRSLSASGKQRTVKTPVTTTDHDDMDQSAAMSYICKLTPRPGALSLEKCVRLGVQSGPLCGKLKTGQSVTLPSGKTIHSKDVCEPDDPGPVFLVVDCPSEDYLDSFVRNKAFKKHQKGATSDQDLAYLVVHFTPEPLLYNFKYRMWVDSFSPSTQHLIINESNTCMGSESVHRVQYQLNLLHEGMFPLLGDKGTKVVDAKDGEMSSTKKIKLEDGVPKENAEIDPLKFSRSLYNNYTYTNTFCNFHLRPKRGFDTSVELQLTPTEYVDEPYRVQGFQKALREFQILVQENMKARKVTQVYPRLVFLGTGSCIPNKTRNTSGILVQISDNTNILMDCGEGTYGQLVRFYGPEKVEQVLSKIKAIFISHLHADHHIGLIGLLQGRRRALINLNKDLQPPVLLLAPKQILTWLNFYDKYFEMICRDFELISNLDLLHDEHTLFEGTQVRIYQLLEMKEINTALVRHCPNAFGLAFSHKNGYKMCYSGDTMPSENLIDIGQNCDVLIHEATMEDDLESEAIIKMHSTTSQAVEVGRNMNARHILLTHFSQRYAKLPRFNDNFGNNVGIAFDNMQIRYDDLPLVPLLYPPLKLMFAQHYEELENKAVKRQLRTEQQEQLNFSQNPSAQSKISSVVNRSFSTASDVLNQAKNKIALRTTSHPSATTSPRLPKIHSNPPTSSDNPLFNSTLSPTSAVIGKQGSSSCASQKASPVSRLNESTVRSLSPTARTNQTPNTTLTSPDALASKVPPVELPLSPTARTNQTSPGPLASKVTERPISPLSPTFVSYKRDCTIPRVLATTNTTIPQLTITNQVRPPLRNPLDKPTDSTNRSPSPIRSHLTIRNK